MFASKGWTPERLGSLAGKTYVITGANAGAGFKATRVFLSKGAKVVMMNRNANKSTAAICSFFELMKSIKALLSEHFSLLLHQIIRRALFFVRLLSQRQDGLCDRRYITRSVYSNRSKD